MARIRTIKPEFPQSESMGRVSRDARLLFVLLWTLADDAGRLRGDSRMLARTLFPYDDGEDGHFTTSRADVESWLTELEAENCLQRYEGDDSKFIQIHNWLKHQKIDKPSKSRIPESSRILSNPREVSSGDLEGKGSITTAAAPPKRSRVPQEAEPPWWQDFRLVYPNRAGDQGWRRAQKAANARQTEGHTPEEFIAGAKRYAAFCGATGKIGTEYVKQAASFLGPDKLFLQPWTPPQTLNGKKPPSDPYAGAI